MLIFLWKISSILSLSTAAEKQLLEQLEISSSSFIIFSLIIRVMDSLSIGVSENKGFTTFQKRLLSMTSLDLRFL